MPARAAPTAHNTDTLEHDIADSDGYFQYHGGMIAAVRALTGRAPPGLPGNRGRPGRPVTLTGRRPASVSR
jgi:cobaltochelatase CobN